MESNSIRIITRIPEDVYPLIKLKENNRDLFPPMRSGSSSLGTTRDLERFCVADTQTLLEEEPLWNAIAALCAQSTVLFRALI